MAISPLLANRHWNREGLKPRDKYSHYRCWAHVRSTAMCDGIMSCTPVHVYVDLPPGVHQHHQMDSQLGVTRTNESSNIRLKIGKANKRTLVSMFELWSVRCTMCATQLQCRTLERTFVRIRSLGHEFVCHWMQYSFHPYSRHSTAKFCRKHTQGKLFAVVVWSVTLTTSSPIFRPPVWFPPTLRHRTAAGLSGSPDFSCSRLWAVCPRVLLWP